MKKSVIVVAGSTHGVSPNTITDDEFLPRNAGRTDGTVYWDGEETTIEIQLGGVFRLSATIVQADANDVYLLYYLDDSTGQYVAFWHVPNLNGFGSGMLTRPNPNDDTEWLPLSPTVTVALQS